MSSTWGWGRPGKWEIWLFFWESRDGPWAGCRLKDGRSLALFSSFLQNPPCRPANSPIAFVFISCKTIFMQTNDLRHYQGWVIACKDLGWFSHRNNYLCHLLVKALPIGLAQRHANCGKITLQKKRKEKENTRFL